MIRLLIGAFVLAASPIWAQPAITSTTGTLTHGQTLTINGSGFTTKSPVAAEGYTGDAITATPAWLTLHQNDVGSEMFGNTNNLRHTNETSNVRIDFKVGDGYFEFGDHTSTTWFVQYWVKLASNWHWGTTFGNGCPDDGLANIKFLRLLPTGATNFSNLGYVLHALGNGCADPSGGLMDMKWFVESINTGAVIGDGENIFTLNTWRPIQFQYQESTSEGVADGKMKLWIDGTVYHDATNIVTNEVADTPAENKRPYIIGFFDSWSPSDAAVANMYAYMSGIYVDDVWNRVEICSGSSWAAKGTCEMQPPTTTWAATQVLVTLNQGVHSTFNGKYLYVVDSAGNVNSSGFVLGGDQQSSDRLRFQAELIGYVFFLALFYYRRQRGQ